MMTRRSVHASSRSACPGCVDDVLDVLGKFSVEEVLLSSPSINGSNEATVREACGKQDVPVRRLYLEIR